MRKFLISLAFLLVAPSVYSQDTARSHPLTKQDYMQKSKNQKTGAFVLLIGGIALGVGGAISAASNLQSNSPYAFLVIGGACIIGSIPLFIAAGRNKRRALAMTAHFNIQQTPVTNYAGLSKRLFPGISVMLNL
jgi:hypothetical protein